MSLLTRIEKLEAKLNEIASETDDIDYVVLFRREEDGTEYCQIRKDGNMIWVTHDEYDKHMEQFKDKIKGTIIFMPLKLTDDI